MAQKSNININFYQNLGILFYAIAAADHSVEAQEIDELKTLLKTEWKIISDFNTRATSEIMTKFEALQKAKENNTETYYNSFITYMKSHPSLFTAEIRTLIMKTATMITTSFSGQNKSELIMLAKLNIELKKLETQH